MGCFQSKFAVLDEQQLGFFYLASMDVEFEAFQN
jgi:hypothetical protein